MAPHIARIACSEEALLPAMVPRRPVLHRFQGPHICAMRVSRKKRLINITFSLIVCGAGWERSAERRHVLAGGTQASVCGSVWQEGGRSKVLSASVFSDLDTMIQPCCFIECII